MDVLYYSNYCKHCQKVIQSLVKGNIVEKISFINIDKRSKDPKTNQLFIHLENGSKVLMPPNLYNVPALLLVNQKFQFIYGDEIIQHFHKDIVVKNAKAVKFNGEPESFVFGGSAAGSNIISEKYTSYNLTPDDLSAKSTSKNRSLYNYVSVDYDPEFIETPADNYHPDKVDGELTVDKLQQQRMDEITRIMPKTQPLGNHI
jgi:hypothetical protein